MEMNELLEEFESFNGFVESLRGMEEDVWASPIAPGKWAVRDIISHILLWDVYFFENGIEKIHTGSDSITVQHLDYDEFNQKAVEYALGVSKDALIDETVRIRSRIVDTIRQIPEESHLKTFRDGDGHDFVIVGYLKDFIWHDNHHRKQIEHYLREVG